jgi:hypothetical protein
VAEDLRVEPYEPRHAEDWDRFVDGSRNGTLFHKRRFLSYHPPDRFEDASLLFYEGNRLVSVFPAAWRRDDEVGRLLQSHPGASHGGPVFGRAIGASGVAAVVEALRAHAERAGADAVRMRIPPRAFHRPVLEEVDFALRLHGFTIWRTEFSTWVPLAAPDEEALLATLESSCRRAVRKAQRSGLVGEESADVDQYHEILADNLKRRFGADPTHSVAELQRLRELFPEEIRLFVAREGERILGGCLVFVCNDEAAHTFYLASREEAQPMRPLNLAVFTAMEWLRARGFQRLSLGVSTPDGLTVNWGLIAFKESFNGRGICRDSYQLVLREG